jgi:hypothetical protein
MLRAFEEALWTIVIVDEGRDEFRNMTSKLSLPQQINFICFDIYHVFQS